MSLETPTLQKSGRNEGTQVRQHRSQVGGMIAELRSKRGMTIESLADRCGISRSHLGRIERGMAMPSYSMVTNIARVLETEMKVFSDYTDRSVKADRVITAALAKLGIPEADQILILRTSLDARELLVNVLADPDGEAQS